ncbi:MAG TPA: TetR/AcrR family transcriptional regulator [Pseudonocardiaceae bacterium]|nr:TetR/AcrR family transcriptional regulator [Pseudonocardiaceae bacterium]
MARPRVHDENLRVRLLDEAGRMLSDEGPEALSMRRLATAVSTSTSAVYSLFGGKPELLRALYLEAFRRFGRYLTAVERTGDPLDDIARLALAYRASALSDPHLYAVMFPRPLNGFAPDPEAEAEALTTFEPLIGLVRLAISQELLVDESAETIAVGLWAIVHGLVSLELNNPDIKNDARYRTVVGAALRGWARRPSAG